MRMLGQVENYGVRAKSGANQVNDCFSSMYKAKRQAFGIQGCRIKHEGVNIQSLAAF